jgi:hypothetical protein
MRHPDAHKAFMLESLPCNPRPFLLELNARIEAYGTAYIQSDEAKGILWLLNTMAYGQLFIIDANDEYVRLRMALDPKPGDPGLEREKASQCTGCTNAQQPRIDLYTVCRLRRRSQLLDEYRGQ